MTFKARVQQVSAPFVARLTRAALRLPLPLKDKKALWRGANRRFFHSRSEILGSDALGHTLNCRLDDFVQRHIAIFGLWEPTLTAYILTKVPVDGIFIDIGANVGYFSLLASARFAKVVSFEPSPSIYAALIRNIELNGIRNIKALDIAISDCERTAPFYRSDRSNSGNSSLSEGIGRDLEGYVRCAPLQTVITDEEWRKVRFIKVDVEGHEAEVISSLLRSVEVLREDLEIVVQIDPRSCAAFDMLCDAGFHAFDLRSNYAVECYLVPGNAGPIPIQTVPGHETDCLFRRSPTLF